MKRRRSQELRGILNGAKSVEELDALLEGLLTPQEIEELILRWRLLQKLLQDIPQREIAKELGISLGKIARGSRLLQYGPPQFRTLVRDSLSATGK